MTSAKPARHAFSAAEPGPTAAGLGVAVLRIETTEAVLRKLQIMVATGLHGHSVERCAEELICRELRRRFLPAVGPGAEP